MKKVILTVATMIFAIHVAVAQTVANPGDSTEVKEKAEIKYSCPKCDYSDVKAGQCPTHSTNFLIKEDTYYCKMHDLEISEKPGNCPFCGGAMVKMENNKTANK